MTTSEVLAQQWADRRTSTKKRDYGSTSSEISSGKQNNSSRPPSSNTHPRISPNSLRNYRTIEKKLEINGVGYKAAVAGKNLQLSLGYSHDITFPIPAGISIATPRPVEIVIGGIDRQQVGQVAAEIRAMRGPEPYKGKGVKYSDEFIFRKEGKKK